MASISHDLNRRVGILVDRAGRIERISVGGAEAVEVPRTPSAPSGRMRFCTLRFLTTRFIDDELPPQELAPLALHRLDALAVIAVNPQGGAGRVRVAHLLPAPERTIRDRDVRRRERPAAPPLPRGAGVVRHSRGSRREQTEDIRDDGQRYRLFSPRPAAELDQNFLELIRALEQEFERVRDRTKVAGREARAFLVHVTTGPRSAAEQSMAELSELAVSANLQVVGEIVQRRSAYDPRTLMGSGKLQDLIVDALQRQVEFLIVDQNLTPAQARAIAEMTDLKVLDRTQLILDIFARRARTHEGKIQVELAQLKYLLPRLSSRGDSGLSRLTGGIGGRGPGEQKLEIDRRRVRDRIRSLERQLVAERKRRVQRRSRRRQRDVPVVSLVGYTNAGKSTLLNLLTRSKVFTEHRMFATLDPTSRRLRLPREREIVINDTVGFIRDLPKDLLAAFRATLEEIEDSDLVIHLVDISHPDHRRQIQAVEGILEELGYADIPCLLVANKVDRVDAEELRGLLAELNAVGISATERSGIREFLEEIDRRLPVAVFEPTPPQLGIEAPPSEAPTEAQSSEDDPDAASDLARRPRSVASLPL